MNILDQVLAQIERTRIEFSHYLPVVEYNGSTVRISNLPTLPVLPALPPLPTIEWPQVEIPDRKVLILLSGTLWMCFMTAMHIYILSHPAIIVLFFVASLLGMLASYLTAN